MTEDRKKWLPKRHLLVYFQNCGQRYEIIVVQHALMYVKTRKIAIFAGYKALYSPQK